MNRTTQKVKTLVFFLAITLTSQTFTFAGVGEPDLKVLGRGVENRETHEVLQLACVGPFTDESRVERLCSELNFVLRSENGQQKFVGERLYLTADGNTRDEVKQQLNQMELSKRWQDSYIFGFTRKIYQKEGAGPALGVMAGITIIATGFTPIGFILAGALMAVPLAYDIVLLPVEIALELLDPSVLPNISQKGADALRDKAKPWWQFRPKVISAKDFASASAQLQYTQLRFGSCPSWDSKWYLDPKCRTERKSPPITSEVAIHGFNDGACPITEFKVEALNGEIHDDSWSESKLDRVSNRAERKLRKIINDSAYRLEGDLKIEKGYRLHSKVIRDDSIWSGGSGVEKVCVETALDVHPDLFSGATSGPANSWKNVWSDRTCLDYTMPGTAPVIPALNIQKIMRKVKTKFPSCLKIHKSARQLFGVKSP